MLNQDPVTYSFLPFNRTVTSHTHFVSSFMVQQHREERCRSRLQSMPAKGGKLFHREEIKKRQLCVSDQFGPGFVCLVSWPEIVSDPHLQEFAKEAHRQPWQADANYDVQILTSQKPTSNKYTQNLTPKAQESFKHRKGPKERYQDKTQKRIWLWQWMALRSGWSHWYEFRQDQNHSYFYTPSRRHPQGLLKKLLPEEWSTCKPTGTKRTWKRERNPAGKTVKKPT